MEAQSILFTLHDDSAGYAVGPGRLPLTTLRNFAAEVSDLLRGDGSGPELSSVEVAIVDGSLALRTSPLADPGLWADLKSLGQTELLDGLNAKRRKVVERWQALARSRTQVRYEIHAIALGRPVIVSANSDYRADDADQWVRVERYVRGEIEDLGGAVKANAHIRLPDGKLLTVDTERGVLRDDKANRLYKPAMVRISAEYNVVTREYRAARLIQFIEHGASFDEREFARLTERGAKAWKDIPDASAWVDALRGHDE